MALDRFIFAAMAAVVCAAVAVRGAGPTTIPVMPEQQTLDLCSDAPPLKVGKWFKGESLSGFRPGQIYVVEFWATWCGPCKEAMPHLTDLAAKFGDKVTFIGVDVWEQPDDASNDVIYAKVAEFIAEKPERMGYSVAADGSDHFMFKNWLLAAHRMNIPSSFIVGKDGKIAWIGHPMAMDSILDQVIAGTWDAKRLLDQQNIEKNQAKRRRDLLMPAFEAFQTNDYKMVVTRLESMIAANPDMAADTQVMSVKFQCLLHADQVAAFAYLKNLYDDKVFRSKPAMAYGFAQTAMMNSTTLGHGEYTMLLAAMDVGRQDGKDGSKNFMFMPPYAEALFRDGQIDNAVQCQKQIIADATPNVGHGGVNQEWIDFQTKKLDEYKASVKAGSTTQPAAINSDQIIKDITDAQMKLNGLLKDNEAFSDPELRKSVGPEATELIKQIAADSAMLNRMSKHPTDPTSQADAYLGKEAALDDAGAQAAIDGLVKSDKSEESVRGRACQIRARWLQAGSDATAQSPVVVDLEKLDRANLDDISLSAMTLGFALDAASPDLKQRLSDTATITMTASRTLAKNAAAAAVAHDRLLRSVIGKPVIIAGKTVSGESFTSADLKGKVLIVDFWATWCHYCVLQLPSLKQIYSKYHEQGLEVVGVSNDHQVEALQKFIETHQVPWPQLFDPISAANEEHNEISRKLNVQGIPQLFLIDRKGIVRMLLEDPVDANGKGMGPITPETISGEVEKLLAEPK